MGLRRLLVLGLLAIALTAYAVVFESSSPPWQRVGKVWDLEPSAIVKIEIDRRVSQAEPPTTIVLERRGAFDWQLLKPFSFEGFLPRIQGLTWQLVDTVRIVTVEPGSEGYENAIPPGGPELSIRFWTDGGREHRIEIGRDHPTQPDHLYVRVDGEVLVTHRDLRKAFAVDVDELRSRALVPIPPSEVVRLRVRAAGDQRNAKIAKDLRRDGPKSQWFFETRPELEGTIADDRILENLLSDLNAWRIESFTSDKVSDLAEYGLQQPDLTLEVHDVDGEKVKLEVGKRYEHGGEKLVYVRRSGGPYVFAASQEPLRWLELDVQALRTTHVLDLKGAEIVGASGRGAGQEFVLRREKIEAAERDSGRVDVPEEYQWTVQDVARKESFEGDRQIIERSLGELRQLLIEEYLVPSAVTPVPPEEQLVLSLNVLGPGDAGGEAQVYTLRFGAPSQAERDKDLGVFEASRSLDASHFLVISAWPERIRRGGYFFRNRKISGVNPLNVIELALSAGGAKWRLAKLGRWVLPGDESVLPGMELDQKLLDDLVETLHADRFRVRDYLPDLSSQELEQHGIGKSVFRWSLSLTFQGAHDGLQRLIIGDELPGSEPPLFYGWADNSRVPFTVSAEVPRALGRLVEHLRTITGKS